MRLLPRHKLSAHPGLGAPCPSHRATFSRTRPWCCRRPHFCLGGPPSQGLPGRAAGGEAAVEADRKGAAEACSEAGIAAGGQVHLWVMEASGNSRVVVALGWQRGGHGGSHCRLDVGAVRVGSCCQHVEVHRGCSLRSRGGLQELQAQRLSCMPPGTVRISNGPASSQLGKGARIACMHLRRSGASAAGSVAWWRHSGHVIIIPSDLQCTTALHQA